jgi:hypothetical protein
MIGLVNDPSPGEAAGDGESARTSGSSISHEPRRSSLAAPENQAAHTTGHKDKPLLKRTGKFLTGKDSWEITSLIFSAACVVAMVAVLIDIQKTSLSARHLLIAPNTVI